MTRVVGKLYGLDGPLNGRLYLKPSTPFIGASKEMSFKIVNGEVDIVVPPNTGSTVFFAGWKDQFDVSRLEYSERWMVPNCAEIALDEVRGSRQVARQGRAAAVDQAMWRAEAQKAQERVHELETEKAHLLLKLTRAESRSAASAGQAASLQSEVSGLQRKLAEAELPAVRTEVVEKQVLPADAQAVIRQARKEITVLSNENEQLKKQIEESVGLSTHFSNLHAEIDRLKIEKQDLLNRIEELKQPRRSTSSLRQEMIANLDRLIDG